jgi:hypothetical protein
MVSVGLSFHSELRNPGEPMAAIVSNTAKIGASLLCSGAILGAAISVANYFSPDSGIAGTPGALLVIVSTLILLVFGLITRSDVQGFGFRVFIAGSALFDIPGSAFAGHLLTNQFISIFMP